jgi:SAM-dependent methyltransferase
VTSDRHEATEIWDRFYASGHRLWYPYEVVVRLVRHHLSRASLDGLVLDHGCGSGNHLEFLARLGVRTHGTDVSPTALQTVRSRFEGAMLPQPALSLVDPLAPLGPQLPTYSHVIAWGSTHYNHRDKVLADIADLIAGLPQGGVMIFQVPSINDVAARQSERLSDGSFRIVGTISGQTGAVCTFPSSHEELRSWLPGLEIRDLGTVATQLLGNGVEYYFAYGIKA